MPFIIHAAWLRSTDPVQAASRAVASPEVGQLFFWGENTDSTRLALSTASASSSATRPNRAAKVPSHPAQMSIGELRRLLLTNFPQFIDDPSDDPSNNPPAEGLSAGASAARKIETPPHRVLTSNLALAKATVWLPSQSNQPLLHQSPMQQSLSQPESDAPAPPAPVDLANWQITGLALPPVQALTLLSQLDQPRRAWGRPQATLSLYRFRLGKDLLFWSSVAKFALEILAGQHYLPSLYAASPLEFWALWRPSLLDARIQQRQARFTEALPPVCRAYNLSSPDDAPAAATLVEHFMTSVVDGAVRQWINGTESLTEKRAFLARNGYAASNGAGTSGLDTSGLDTSGLDTYGLDTRGLDTRGLDTRGLDTRGLDTRGLDTNSVDTGAAWLNGLLGDRSRLSLPPQPAHQLYREWNSWTEQLYITSDANARICFALEEPAPHSEGEDDIDGRPAEQGEMWTLRYYLQARDNESLLIAAREVWQSQGQALRLGERRLDRPQERLLAGLGAASRLFPPIRQSLSGPQPEEALLTTDEAHQFLREVGPVLESSGFGVIFPLWWQAGHRTRLGLRLRFFDENVGGEFGDDEFDDAPASTRYAWELTLGGAPLTTDEFAQLAALQTPLVRLRDRWVELEREQVEAAQRFLNSPARARTHSLSLLDAIRMAQTFSQTDTSSAGVHSPASAQPTSAGEPSLDLPADLLGELTSDLTDDLPLDVLPLDAVDVEGWLADVLTRLQGDVATGKAVVEGVAEPNNFIGTLRPYQRRGVGWLAYLRRLGLGACLADDMGLGKSVQAIALLLHVRDRLALGKRAEQATPSLLICPTSVVTNWRREVERFAPTLRALVHHGNGRLAGEDFHEAVATHDLIVTSYGTARRDVDLLLAHEWDDLILDEAQNIKNPSTKQTQAVRRLRARHRMALTGTPVENRLSELWSIVEFLNPGYLGSYDRFRRSYIVPIERYNDDSRAAELRALVRPFLLRRLKSDPTIISDLPAKTEMVTYCTLTSEQASLYEKVVGETLAQVDSSQGIQRRGLVLGLLTKLKQICNHPAHYLKEKEPLADRSGKLARLDEMLEEALAIGDRALVFTQFVEMGRLLQRYLRETRGVEVLFLHGGTTATARDQMVQAFQSENGPPVFVLSLRAGGSGINLTQANHVFHFDRWWNPAVENQATDRAFRIGQTRNVQVHKFVVAGTLEERIHDLIESKQALAETIVGSGEEWLTELNTNQLRDLLALRREMVE